MKVFVRYYRDYKTPYSVLADGKFAGTGLEVSE